MSDFEPIPSRLTKGKVARGRHLFLRDAAVDLYAVLQGLEDSIQHLHIYCHSLEYKSTLEPKDRLLTISLPDESKLRSLTIFSCFLLQDANANHFALAIPASQFRLRLYFQVSPMRYFKGSDGGYYSMSRMAPKLDQSWRIDRSVTLGVAKEIQDKQTAVVNTIVKNAEAAGFEFIIIGDATEANRLRHILAGEFQKVKNPGVAQRIDIVEGPSIFENLPKLLNSLFFEACDLVFEAITRGLATVQKEYEYQATQYLSFVKRCTNNCAAYSALNKDASELYDRLLLPTQDMGLGETGELGGCFYVPTLDYSDYLKSLNIAFNRCRDIAAAIEKLESEKRTAQAIASVGEASLIAIAALGDDYKITDTTNTALLNAISMTATKRKEMAERKDSLMNARARFVQGLDEYHYQKKMERDDALLWGAVEIGVTVVVCLCVNPAGVVPALKDVGLGMKDMALDLFKSDSASAAVPKPKPGSKWEPQLFRKRANALNARLFNSDRGVKDYDSDDQDDSGSEQMGPPGVSNRISRISDFDPYDENPGRKKSSVLRLDDDRKSKKSVLWVPPDHDEPKVVRGKGLPSQIDIPGLSASQQKSDDKKSVVSPDKKKPDPQPDHQKTDKKGDDRKSDKTGDEKKDGQEVNPLATIWDTAYDVGPKMYEAYQAYKNNAIINGRADEATQKKLLAAVGSTEDRVSQIITKSSAPIDYFGLMADWDEIKLSVENFFKRLESQGGDKISGFQEYSNALLNMITRGRALLNSQRELQGMMTKYYQTVQEAKLQKVRGDRIMALSNTFKKNPKILEDYQEDYRASYVIMCRSLMLRIHDCFLSLMYRHAHNHNLSVKVTSGMSINEFNTVRDQLRLADLKNKQSRSSDQLFPRTIIRSAELHLHKVFKKGWKESLLKEGKIPFGIPLDYAGLKRYYNCRALDFSVEFFSKSGKAFTNVEYYIFIGPHFLDRDVNKVISQYYVTIWDLEKVDKEGQWNFFTKPNLETEPCKPGLFANGYIYFDPLAAKELSIPLGEIDNFVLTVIYEGSKYY